MQSFIALANTLIVMFCINLQDSSEFAFLSFRKNVCTGIMEFNDKWPALLGSLIIFADFLLYYYGQIPALAGITAAGALAMLYRFEDTRKSFARYWPVMALTFVVLFGIHSRIYGYNFSYLRNIDSYAFTREMQMIVENGYLQTTDPLFFRSPYENTLTAPLDFNLLWILRAPYQYLGAYSFMLVRSFMPMLELWRYLIVFPPVLASVAAIPMYFIGREMYDRKAGIMAALLYIFDISNFQRSLGGDPDTDAIVMLMPMLVMAFYLLMHRRIDSRGLDKVSALFAVLGGVSLALFQNVWAGYWYTVWIIAVFLVVKLGISAMRLGSMVKMLAVAKPHLMGFALLFLAYLAVNFQFFGAGTIISTVFGPFEYGGLKNEVGRAFPNVYVSVAELQQPGDVVSIIKRVTGIDGPALWLSPFMLTVYALAGLAMLAASGHKRHLDGLIILFLWFMGPMLATLVAVRFTILFSAPMSIGTAILFSMAYGYVAGEFKKADVVKTEAPI